MVVALAISSFVVAVYLVGRGCYAVVALAALVVSIASSTVAAELSFDSMRARAAVAAIDQVDFSAMRSTPAAGPALSFEAMARRQPEPEPRTSAAVATPPPAPPVRHVPVLQPAAACVGPQCVTPQGRRKAKGLFGLLLRR